MSECAPGCGAEGPENAAIGGHACAPASEQEPEKRSKNAGAQPSAFAPPAPPPPPTRITTRSQPGEGVAVGEGVGCAEGVAEGVVAEERLGAATEREAVGEGTPLRDGEGSGVALPHAVAAGEGVAAGDSEPDAEGGADAE